MNLKTKTLWIIVYIYLSTVVAFSVRGVLPEDRTITSIKTINARANRIYQKINIPELSDQKLWRPGLRVDETILADPKKATRKGMGLSKNEYLKEEWIGCESGFDADYLIKNPEPLPTELPDEIKRSVGGALGKNENENQKYLAKMLESYRKSKEYVVKGQIAIQVVNTPSPQAAFEYLVVQASNCSMMDEAVINQFNNQSKVSGLGTVGYAYQGKALIRFIRDNIAVIILGDGEFENESMDIAKKIDAALLKQPLLTYEQLQARCPKLHIQPGKKAAETDVPFLEYSVEAPAGVEAWPREIKINDKVKSARENKILLEEKPKKVKVQATVISTELLVSTYETEIDMPVAN